MKPFNPFSNNRGQLNLDFLNPFLQRTQKFIGGAGNFLGNLLGDQMTQGRTVNPFEFMGPQGQMVRFPGATIERGSGGGGFNLGNILGNIFGGGNQGGGLDLSGLLRNPLVGAGLLGIGAAQKEPGEIGEARQFLRNIFNEPTTIDQAELDKILNNVQQRAIAGLPTSFSTAMGGPEIRAIREATAAEVGKQAETDLGNRIRAAQSILATQQPGIGDALSQLGMASLFGGGQGGLGDLLGQGGQGGIGGLLQSILGGGQGTGGGLGGLLQSILGGGQGTGGGGVGGLLQSILGSGQGGGGLGGILSSLGGLFGGGGVPGMEKALLKSLAETGQLGAGDVARITGGGGLSSLMSLLGPLAVGGAGFGLGNLIGKEFSGSTTGGALGGAAAGAATGAAIGSIVPGIGTAIGALIGGLAGAGGGLFGGHKERAEIKAANRSADVMAQQENAQAFGDFLTNQVGLLGGDVRGPAGVSGSDFGINITPEMSFSDIVNRFTESAMNITTELPGIASVLGPELLRRFQTSNPSYQTLDDVPGLRRSWLDFMKQNMVIAGSAAGQSVSDISQGTRFALASEQGGLTGTGISGTDVQVREVLRRAGFSLAGLVGGGRALTPLAALVGESGPELALLAPGSEILPLRRKSIGAMSFS